MNKRIEKLGIEADIFGAVDINVIIHTYSNKTGVRNEKYRNNHWCSLGSCH